MYTTDAKDKKRVAIQGTQECRVSRDHWMSKWASNLYGWNTAASSGPNQGRGFIPPAHYLLGTYWSALSFFPRIKPLCIWWCLWSPWQWVWTETVPQSGPWSSCKLPTSLYERKLASWWHLRSNSLREILCPKAPKISYLGSLQVVLSWQLEATMLIHDGRVALSSKFGYP